MFFSQEFEAKTKNISDSVNEILEQGGLATRQESVQNTLTTNRNHQGSLFQQSKVTLKPVPEMRDSKKMLNAK